MVASCEEPLINRFFSIVGRLGVFRLLLDYTATLTLSQLRILFHLYYHDGKIMSEIAAFLQVSDPTATGIVDRLVQRGLVERVADPADRRRVQVELSSVGRQRVSEMRQAGAEAAAEVFGQLTSAQRDALFQALEPVYQLLTPTG
jgi:DNA-binding MarR family transcriptional regulator